MFNALLITFISGLSTVVGALVIFLKIKPNNVNKLISFSLSFSATIMIGISITDLIPHSIFNLINKFSLLNALIIIIITVFLGYFSVKILTKVGDLVIKEGDLYKLGVFSTITLLLHNLPEGIAVFSTSYISTEIGLKLALAIMMHNIPEGICIAVPIYYASISKIKALGYSVIAGLAEPIGALITYFFFKDYINLEFIDITLLFAGSLMISLAINEIFCKAITYDETKFFKLGILLSLSVLLLNIILL